MALGPTSAATIPARSIRARATRDRTVPTGQPSTSAAAVQLGQHEGLAPIRLELEQRRGDRLRHLRPDVHGLHHEPILQAALAHPSADRIGARVARDRQQPGQHSCVPPEAAERAHGTKVRVLHKIVCLAGAAQRDARPPNIALRASHELGERVIITLLGSLEQVTQRVEGHEGIMPEVEAPARIAWTPPRERATQCP